MTNETEIFDELYDLIIEHLQGYPHGTLDFTKPCLKLFFAKSWPLVIAPYAILIILSLIANVAMVYHICRYRRHDKSTCGFLVNAALSNILHMGVCLPVTTINTIMHNWLFGKFMCYFTPMLQDIPIHVMMMTFILIVVDRYRFLSDPRNPRIPSFVCSVGTWFFAICIALPHPIYVTFLDLQLYASEHIRELNPKLRYQSMCIANLESHDDIHEYVKSLFIGTFIAPLALLMYIYAKSSTELKNHEGPLTVAFEARNPQTKLYSRRESNGSNDISLTIPVRRESESSSINGVVSFSNFLKSDDIEDSEYDVQREARTQKYLFAMVATFAVCLFPLMILRLAKQKLTETYENMHQLDVVYLIFIWLAFLPALTTPCLYFAWKMSRRTRNRWRRELSALIFCRKSKIDHTTVTDGDYTSSYRSSFVTRGGYANNDDDDGMPRDRGNSLSINGSTSTVLASVSSAGPRSPRFGHGLASASALDVPGSSINNNYSRPSTTLSEWPQRCSVCSKKKKRYR